MRITREDHGSFQQITFHSPKTIMAVSVVVWAEGDIELSWTSPMHPLERRILRSRLSEGFQDDVKADLMVAEEFALLLNHAVYTASRLKRGEIALNAIPTVWEGDK